MGFSGRAIAQALQDGVVVRAARGHYALPGLGAMEVLLAQHQAQLSCLSRVTELGLWLLTEPERPHVSVAHGRAVPGCIIHRCLPNRQTGHLETIEVLRQVVRCGSELEAFVVLESAVVLKVLSLGELKHAFAADSKGRKMVALIDPQSMSIAETVARFILQKAGFNVQAQAYIRGVGHLDLLVEGVLGLETDGRAFHASPQAWAEDLRRDTQYVLNGIWRLRVPAAVVLYQPELLLSWVSQALQMISSAQVGRP